MSFAWENTAAEPDDDRPGYLWEPKSDVVGYEEACWASTATATPSRPASRSMVRATSSPSASASWSRVRTTTPSLDRGSRNDQLRGLRLIPITGC